MDRVTLVPASFRHVARIANRLREADRLECAAMGRTPKQSLRMGLMYSDKCWTALVDDLPEAMFGVVVESALTGQGTPWFLGTDEVYRHARELLLWGPGLVARLHDSSRELRNVVSAENAAAIRLLRRWGFTVEEDQVDVRGMPHRRFEKVLG